MDGRTLDGGGAISGSTMAQSSEIRGGKPRRFLPGERSRVDVQAAGAGSVPSEQRSRFIPAIL